MHSWLVLPVGTVNCLLVSEVSVLNGMRMEYITIFKPGACWLQAGAYLVSYNCFCADICVCVCLCVCACACVCVCVPIPRLLTTSGLMWRDVDPMRFVKQVLQLLYGNCSHYR